MKIHPMYLYLRGHEKEFDNIDDIQKYVNESVKYKREKYDNWQYAYETMDRKKGDCEDKAIPIIAYMDHNNMGVPKLVVLKNKKKKYHAAVEWCGVVYDSVTSGLVDMKRWKVVQRFGLFSLTFYIELKRLIAYLQKTFRINLK